MASTESLYEELDTSASQYNSNMDMDSIIKELRGQDSQPSPTSDPATTMDSIIRELRGQDSQPVTVPVPASTPPAPVTTETPDWSTTPAVEGEGDAEFTMDDLNTKSDWVKQAKTIYRFEKGEDWKGSDTGVAEWFKNRHSRLGNNLVSMGLTAIETGDMDDTVKDAWIKSMDTYDKTDSDVGSFLRALKNMALDPTFLGSAVVTMGIGGVARALGGRAASAAARFAFKQQLEKALIKEGIGKGTAKIVAKEGAAKGVSKEIIGKARKEAAKKVASAQTLTGGSSGAAWGGLFDLSAQSMEMGLDEEKEFDFGRLALSTGLGAGIGLGAGRYIPLGIERLGRGKALRKAEKLREETMPKGTFSSQKISKGDSLAEVKQTARKSQDELELNSEVDIDLEIPLSRKRGALADIDYTEKDFINTWRKAGFDIERVKNSPKKYKAVKISEQVNKVTPDRTVGESAFMKFKRGVSTTFLGEEAKLARTKLDASVRRGEQNVNRSFNNLKRAIKKDYDIPAHKMDQTVLTQIDDVFRGKTEAIEELTTEGRTNTLDAIRQMRENIQFLQNDLLESGAIKSDDALYGKIQKSMDGDEVDFFVNRQYEVFDNPNWKKTLKTEEGMGIVESARDSIAKSQAKHDKSFKDILDKVELDIGNIEKANPEAFQEASARRAAVNNLSEADKSIYSKYMGQDGSVNKVIDNILDVESEEDLFKAFSDPQFFGRKRATKILSKRENIPKAIRDLMGEYKDPFTNYGNTFMKLNQVIETYNYEKTMADLIRRGQIEGAAEEAIPSEFITKELSEAMPERKAVDPQRYTIKEFEAAEDGIEDVAEDVIDDSTISSYVLRSFDYDGSAIDKPLKGMYATEEAASAIAIGNEIANSAMLNFKPLQKYLLLQGHARAAKTVWSATAIARNFLGAGWMSVGAGYLRPSAVRGMMKIAKGLAGADDKEIQKYLEKSVALNLASSGTDIGSFRGAMQDAGEDAFWNLQNPMYQGTKQLQKGAKKLNTSAVKLYQSMDDVWKQFAFQNEIKNYRQVMIDSGIDPDKPKRILKSADGDDIIITELDEYAAQQVNNHMQNYAGVPQAVRYARLLPAADFLAFTTELIRTTKNILKTSVRDIRDGHELMAKKIPSDGPYKFRGQAQAVVGYRRLGSFTSAVAAAPALALTSATVLGLNEKEKGQRYTIKEGIESLIDAPWEKGSNFIYYGVPDKNGEGRRVNISYINPYAKFTDPLRAAYEALNKGGNADGAIEEAVKEAVWKPVAEALGPSMVLEAATRLLITGRDEYGRELFKATDNIGQQFKTGVLTTLQTFEPGIIKSARDIITSYNVPGTEVEREVPLLGVKYDTGFGVRPGKTGRKLYTDDQYLALSGVKPQAYNMETSLNLKINNIKRNMGEASKIFQNAYKDRQPKTITDLMESYDESLQKQYSQAKDMFELITKAKSAGMSNSDIFKAVTDDGLFKSRMDKNIIRNMINRGIFIPPKPNIKDMNKWAMSTKKLTGVRPPVNKALREIMSVYGSYAGTPTGRR
jgi:hypothetical protein|tara:strand:+ start:7124 stop:11695 length:4572 start_codon:yes stop_codon:yes gene_type:complete